MQGLRSQEKRSLHGVNEHFFDERNAADGHYGQTLIMSNRRELKKNIHYITHESTGVSYISAAEQMRYFFYVIIITISLLVPDNCLAQEEDNDRKRVLFDFDQSGNISEYVFQFLSDDGWIDDIRWTFTYNKSGETKEKIEQYRDFESNTWINHQKYISVFDGNGFLKEYYRQFWVPELDLWQNNWREVYKYDNHGNNTIYIEQDWDQESMQWINYFRNLYFYDGERNLLQTIAQSWIAEENAWIEEDH